MSMTLVKHGEAVFLSILQQCQAKWRLIPDDIICRSGNAIPQLSPTEQNVFRIGYIINKP
jgi:hypothetical protein